MPSKRDPSELAALRDGGLTWKAIGDRYGVSKATVQKEVKRWQQRQGLPDPERVTMTDGPTGRTVESPKSGRVKTLDDLLAASETDLERWKVDRHVVNKWEVGARTPDGEIAVQDLWQVKAWLSARTDLIEARAIVDGLLADIATAAPKRTAIRRAKLTEPHMLEFGLYDHHIGMLAWHEECGSDYDSDIADRLAQYAVEIVLQRCKSYDIERVLLPIGHDWLHTDAEIDGKGGVTTKGTAQDVDTRPQKMFRRAVRVARGMVDTFRDVAPVDVVIVPGNHDRTRAFAVGEVLGAVYESDPEVTVTNTPGPRDYVEYGVSMIGLGHGDDIAEKELPLTMAQEAPEMWGRTRWREFHRGHTHGTRVLRFAPARDVGGVIVRTISSMVAEESWHTGKGYRHQRAAEAFIWHRDLALMGTIVVGVPSEFYGQVDA